MSAAAKVLDLYKSERNIPSDYAAAKALGISPQAVSKWRSGASAPSTDTVALIAKQIGANPAELVAMLEASNAPKPERKAWEESAQMAEVYRAVFEIVASDPKMSKEVSERVKQMPAERRERIGAWLAKRGMYGVMLMALVGAGTVPAPSGNTAQRTATAQEFILCQIKRKKRRGGKAA